MPRTNLDIIESAATPLVDAVSLGHPVQRYARSWAETGWTCFLDSAMAGGPRGQWSFVAGPPRCALRIRRAGDVAEIETLDVRVNESSARLVPCDGVWAEIRRALDTHRAAIVQPNSDVPFVGGAIGYVGYEAQHFIESLPRRARPGLGLPDVYLLFVDSVLAVDHATRAATLATICADPREREILRAAWMDRIRSIDATFDDQSKQIITPGATGGLTTGAVLHHAAYIEAVERIKNHIAAGDLYQANLTYQDRIPFAGDPWRLYQDLRVSNPAPFAAYLQLPEAAVVCCSPERFLRLDTDGRCETRPIKGTRPRGGTPADDARLRNELDASEKDRAEHAMIVDLLRNDFGRVCSYRSVRVDDLMSIESYRSVHQMVSSVCGRLRPGHDAVDLLRACFPGGSMTGAPKIAAMNLINELEPVERGVYSGCIGYFDVRGGMDLNIVIRTAVIAGGIAHIGTGGAIVADSDPAAEWAETLHKSRPLRESLADSDQSPERIVIGESTAGHSSFHTRTAPKSGS